MRTLEKLKFGSEIASEIAKRSHNAIKLSK